VTRLVVDASVAAKWLVREPLSDPAVAILDSPDELLAPDLLLPEVGNVLWKKVRSGELTDAMALERFAALMSMGVKVVTALSLSARALHLALQTGRTVYDSMYLALAEAHECRLVTADERLVSALRPTPWNGLAVFLGDL
jgi:predicted nucleic acid-binding protein